MPRAKKSLGQNFLVDPNIQHKIVAALEPAPDDVVLEIGPGTGALTRLIAGKVQKLVAVELDDDLVSRLRAEFAGRADVTILHRDFLELDLADVSDDPTRLKIIGNIPYNITTPLIFHLLERDSRPAVIVLMVQREVADRILAPPHDKAYGALSVGIRTVAAVERLFHVKRGAFRPVPNVDSTVLRIVPARPPPLTPNEEEDLRALTRAAFGWRRKQLQKTLRSSEVYGLGPEEVTTVERESGIALDTRPEDLAPEQFVTLAATLRRVRAPRGKQPGAPTDYATARMDESRTEMK